MQLLRSIGLLLLGIAFSGSSLSFRLLAQSQQPKQQQNTQENQYRDQAQTTLRDQQQQESNAYRGKVSEKNGKFYLEEAYTKTSYSLEGAWQPQRFVNKKVRVTGSLDAEKNILHVISISPAP